jgi:thioredoxin 1
VENQAETTEQILEDVKSGKHILKLWAVWCGPCKAYAPAFDEATADLKDIKVRSVNVDDHSDLAQKFGVRGIPTTILINGDKVHQEAGTKTVDQLKSLIATHLAE